MRGRLHDENDDENEIRLYTFCLAFRCPRFCAIIRSGSADREARAEGQRTLSNGYDGFDNQTCEIYAVVYMHVYVEVAIHRHARVLATTFREFYGRALDRGISACMDGGGV